MIRIMENGSFTQEGAILVALSQDKSILSNEGGEDEDLKMMVAESDKLFNSDQLVTCAVSTSQSQVSTLDYPSIPPCFQSKETSQPNLSSKMVLILFSPSMTILTAPSDSRWFFCSH
ncbi:hypothetical protein SLEP1_g21308 [Rubroshorea leprosula]|uniref:Uncharacterized protein n=1 Tax=Rubroshorea leprosula TaxID=152421 RepID=A0AAV5JEN4_9ROSI|nr:hypothetical protein SLEP1_g21308 [Rubroshorea leprosula]